MSYPTASPVDIRPPEHASSLDTRGSKSNDIGSYPASSEPAGASDYSSIPPSYSQPPLPNASYPVPDMPPSNVYNPNPADHKYYTPSSPFESQPAPPYSSPPYSSPPYSYEGNLGSNTPPPYPNVDVPVSYAGPAATGVPGGTVSTKSQGPAPAIGIPSPFWVFQDTDNPAKTQQMAVALGMPYDETLSYRRRRYSAALGCLAWSLFAVGLFFPFFFIPSILLPIFFPGNPSVRKAATASAVVSLIMAAVILAVVLTNT